ncbi:ABC transporter substrate-binding protein [Iodobacter fluviatilis]|jgi:iron complex transport system substrate-binding protein|uniref:ABC transporter substrate-binding protein n=1 Tax=Iodobacter fluviatilis TaxID=537 RepID=A0A7G3GC57_9NEIS|nr:ABC transporter substrate-binding protein [Iodobacter fluviatilis]QBC44748.1 ABC transporter substrate-binding protein [Iodobacter fluviatilis]
MNKKYLLAGTVFVLAILAAFSFSPKQAVESQALAPVAMHTITDAMGRKVTLPLKPQRVIALGEFDLDALLALGIEPVGTSNGRGQQTAPNYLQTIAAKVPSVGAFAQPTMDKVIAAQPDLIITSTINDEQILNQLQKIAPTVVSIKNGTEWKSAFSQFAGYLNRDAEAKVFLKQYQDRADQLQGKLAAHQNETVSIVRWNPKGPGYMFNDAFASLVIRDLQLARPKSQMQPGVAHSHPLSLEALDQIDADWLFLGTLSPEGEAANMLKTVKDSPAFAQLNAVKQNHVVVIDGSLWTSAGGPLAALAILNDVEKFLLSPKASLAKL